MRFFLIFNFILLISFSLYGQKDTIKKIVNPVDRFPYYIDRKKENLQIELPTNLRVDSIQGRIIAHVNLDSNANVLNLKWVVLLLKNKNGNYFIQYREAVNKEYEIKDYPLPVRPYVRLVQKRIKELEFKRRKDVPLPERDWNYTLSYTIPYKVY